MTFRHGVYTSEVETALQAAPAVDSALPFVVGASKNAFAPTVVTSWRQFVELSGITEGTDDVPGEDGWFAHSLVSFAYLWFRLCGRGDCIMRGIASADGELDQASIMGALDDIDTVYERVRRLPSLIVVPYFGSVAAIWTAIKTKAALYGGRFKALAVGDIQCSEHALSGSEPTVISDPSAVAAAKTVVSESLALFWPYIGIGNMRFDLSSVACAVMNRVDGQNGDLPYVSPSNKNCYATGVYTMSPDETEVEATVDTGGPGGAWYYINDADGYTLKLSSNYDRPGYLPDDGVYRCVEFPDAELAENAVAGDTYLLINSEQVPAGTSFTLAYYREGHAEYAENPLYQSRDEVNSFLGANGVIGALNTADGWVLWGNNTTAFPGNLDVKDNMLSIRRMFNYVQNAFQLFAQPRIDNPLNRRQLEGVVNAFNQVLASYQGAGALNAASVAIDDERNTTEQLIRGVVYFRIRIAPPPPMQEINGVFEFDVQGFEASLA